MQIVINISDEIYKRCRNYSLQCGQAEILEAAVAQGTPLPKGHGALKDADALWDEYHANDYDFYAALDDAPTIIEADKEEEE